jgi:hypothetical protein
VKRRSSIGWAASAFVSLAVFIAGLSLIPTSTGLAQESGEEVSVSAWSDGDCIAHSATFVIPPGWIGTEVRTQAATSWLPCAGIGHTDRVGYAVTGPVAWSGGVSWGGEAYGTQPPDILPSGSYEISMASYGKNDSYALHYTLQPDSCTPGERKTVQAWSDSDCIAHETLFTIPSGCMAVDLSAAVNPSWLPCSGPGHPDRVGYTLTGPGGSWTRGVTWERDEYGPDLPATLPTGSYRFEMNAWGKTDSCSLSYTLQKAPGAPGGVVPTVIVPGGSGTLDMLDLIFCIDVTGSMDDDIDSVKAAAAGIVDTVAAANDDYRVAIIAYRDWDDSMGLPMFEDFPFSSDKDAIIANINSLSVGGGDDTPEAVFEALMRAIDSTAVGSWRNNVNKQVILMGDAPPHDPSREGYTPAIVAQAAEDADPVVIQAVVVGNDGIYDEEAVAAFRQLAELTQGNFFEAADASQVPEVLQETIKFIEPPSSSMWSNVSLLLIGGLCLLGLIVLGVVALVIILLAGRRRRRSQPGPQYYPGAYPAQPYAPSTPQQQPYAPPPQYAGPGELVLLRGQARPGAIFLSQPVVRIGRALQDNDIVIPHPSVSSHHAEIAVQRGGPVVQDLRSTNGTFVNGQRLVQPQPLRDGDRITIGDSEWLYRRSGGTAMMPQQY